MPLPVRQHRLVVGVRVAVAAEMRTRVVHTDVLRDDAAARRALAFVLLGLRDLPSVDEVVFRAKEIHQRGIVMEEPNHQVVVHALVMPYAERREVDVLRARRECQAKFAIEVTKARDEFDLLVVRELAASRPREIAHHLAIAGDVREAEDELLRATLQGASDRGDAVEQGVDRNGGRKQKRIVSPDDALLVDAPRERAEGLDAFLDGRHIRLESLAHIVVERELEVVLAEAQVFEFVETRQQGIRVFRPEDDHSRLLERHLVDLTIERIRPRAEPLAQPRQQPLGVELRHVRRSTRRDDCGGEDAFYG